MKLWILAFASISLALAGCATKLRVTYQSDPPAATLYQDGQPMGVTPYELVYQVDESFKLGGCQDVRGTMVKWASGATAEISRLTACANLGYRQSYVFIRPDVPGRDVDLNYALQLQRNQIMKQRADAAAAPPRPVTCTTNSTGITATTVCK